MGSRLQGAGREVGRSDLISSVETDRGRFIDGLKAKVSLASSV